MTEHQTDLGKFRQRLIDMLMEDHNWNPKDAEVFAEKATRGWIFRRATRPPDEDVQS